MKWFWLGAALFVAAIVLLFQKQFLFSAVMSIAGMMSLQRLKKGNT